MKYTLPAFLVPVAFTASSQGVGLLMRGPLSEIVWATASALVGLSALAVGLGGWLRAAANPLERIAAAAAGLLLMYGGAGTEVAGVALFASVIGVHLLRTCRS